jgi:hypothetical protein
MALRKPLVIAAGQIEQLQAGDTLDAPQSGGDIQQLTNDEVAAVVIGSAVYIDAVNGFKKAQANAAGTRLVRGLVATSPSIGSGVAGSVLLSGVLTATTGQWDAVTGDVGGLTFNQRYWLSASSSGGLTKTSPSTTGQYVVEVGTALSTTELAVAIQRDILL